MFGYELPGTTARSIYRAKAQPDYAGQTECVGYDAVIDGLRWTTEGATLLAGPVGFKYGEDGTRLFRTRGGRFFSLYRAKIVPLSEAAARDKFAQLYFAQRVTEEEAFGSPAPLA